MTAKERRQIYQAIGLALTLMGLALAIPALVSAHDTVALLAAFLLGIAWVAWLLTFLAHLGKEINK